MTTTTVTVAQSTYAKGITHAHFFGHASTLTSGTLGPDGWVAFRVERGGSILAGSRVNGTHNYAHVTRLNGDKVWYRAEGEDGNHGAWASTTITVAEIDVDDDAAADLVSYVSSTGNNAQSGLTSSLPVEDADEAWSDIKAGWTTDGAHVIWLAQGQAFTLASLTGHTARGRVIFRRWGTGGAAPTLAITGDVVCGTGQVSYVFDGVEVDLGADLVDLDSGITRTVPYDFISIDSSWTTTAGVMFGGNDQLRASADRDAHTFGFLAFVDSTVDGTTGASSFQLYGFSHASCVAVIRTTWTGMDPAQQAHPWRVMNWSDVFVQASPFTPGAASGNSIRFQTYEGDGVDSATRRICFVDCPELEIIVKAHEAAASETWYVRDAWMVNCAKPFELNRGGGGQANSGPDAAGIWHRNTSIVDGYVIDPDATLGLIRSIGFIDCAFGYSVGGGYAFRLFGATTRYSDGAIRVQGCAAYFHDAGDPEGRRFFHLQSDTAANFAPKLNAANDRNLIIKSDGDATVFCFDGSDYTRAQWTTATGLDANSEVVLSTAIPWTTPQAVGLASIDPTLTSAGYLAGKGRSPVYGFCMRGNKRTGAYAGPDDFGSSTALDDPPLSEPIEANAALTMSMSLSASATVSEALTIVNEAATERTETIRVSVPFATGTQSEAGLASKIVGGLDTAWLPLQYWADGTVKVAQAQFTDTLAAAEIKGYDVGAGVALSAAFEQHAWVAATISDLRIGAQVLDTFDVAYQGVIAPDDAAEYEVMQSTSLVRVTRQRAYHTRESGGIGRDYLSSTFYVTEFKDAPILIVDWIIGNDYLGADSPNGSADQNLYALGAVDVNEAHFLVKDAHEVAAYRAVKEGIGAAGTIGDYASYQVMADDWIGDGQTRRYRFFVLLVPGGADPGEVSDWEATLAAMESDPLNAIATQARWESTKAAGLVGGPISGPANANALAVTELSTWEAADHFGTWGTRGDTKDTNTAGTPINHPLCPAWAHVIQGQCHGLLVKLEGMAWIQAARANHLYGLELDDDTTSTLWEGMPFLAAPGEHFGRRTLRDSDPYPAYRTLVPGNSPIAADPHGWQGWDHEHYSADLLFDYWTATGDEWAKEELRQRGQSMKALMRLLEGTTSNIQAARAEGWCLWGLVQSYQATQDTTLKTYMMRRINEIVEPQRRKTHASQAMTFQESHPATEFPNPHEFFMPWQHAGVLYGFLGAYIHWGEPILLTIAESVATTVQYSWVSNVETIEFGLVAEGLRYFVPASYNNFPVPADFFDPTVGVRFEDSPLGAANGELIGGLFHLAKMTSDAAVAATALYHGSLLLGDVETFDRSYKWHYCLPFEEVAVGGIAASGALAVSMSLSSTVEAGVPEPTTPPPIRGRTRLSLRLGLGV